MMNNLEKIIACINSDHVFIQTHNFPDPDAIASAYGLQHLLRQKGINSTICYMGRIDRSSSSNMVDKLGINIVELEEMEKPIGENEQIILVDSQKGNANTINLPVNRLICIDHHPTFEKAEYEYSDIRPDVGACASIIAEYFFENSIDMDITVATALMYGIKIDTANMTRAVSDLDLEMFYKLYRKTNMKLLVDLDTSVLKYDDLRAYANAIRSIEIDNRICFANTGANSPEPLIASICDFIMALNEVDIAVVYSLRQDGIKLSIRGNGVYNVGRIANKALENIGNGGGHEKMAGGFVPYNYGDDMREDEQKQWVDDLLSKIQQQFTAIMIDYING